MLVPNGRSIQPAAPGGTGRPTWHLVRTWARTCAGQMAVDQALAESVWAGRRPPTLRVYGWRNPGLTIGRLQRLGTPPPGPAVRRWTGGRAVHHQHEVTLALALPAGHPLIAPTIRATYSNVIAPIVAGLAALGLPVAPPAAGPSGERAADRFGCFTAPTREEPEIGGRKVVALAQRLGPGGLLAQASIPLRPPEAFGGPEAAAMAGLARFRPGLTWEALAGAILEGFATTLGVGLVSTPLTGAERRRAAALAAGPYAPENTPAGAPRPARIC